MKANCWHGKHDVCRLTLADAPNGYDTFLNNKEECIKVVMTP